MNFDSPELVPHLAKRLLTYFELALFPPLFNVALRTLVFFLVTYMYYSCLTLHILLFAVGAAKQLFMAVPSAL